MKKIYNTITWRLYSTITREEIKWLQKNNCHVSIEPVETIDLSYYGNGFKVAGAASYITILTTSEEIATLLRLKYDTRIVNIKEEWTMDTGDCTLSEVKINDKAW